METVQRDYAPKGVEFYYIYKPLAHPEYNNYVSPFSIEERLMHVHEAERRLGSSITWLADTMDNVYHDSMGQTPNSEVIVDPDGIVVARRVWSDPEALRSDLTRLLGPVEHRTKIEDLGLPTQPPPPTVAKGVVPRVEPSGNMMPIEVDPVHESTDIPFYAKLRADANRELITTGTGTLYLGLHLDPLYRVHWNNEVDAVEIQITAPEGVTVTPSRWVGPDPSAAADADPREVLIDVVAGESDHVLDVRAQYFACDDALTFCIPVRQEYKVQLTRDTSHGGAIRTGTDNRPVGGRVPQ